jgi:hypothetical protein
VEVSNALNQIRDSKNPTGPALRVDVSALVRAAKAGRFDR